MIELVFFVVCRPDGRCEDYGEGPGEDQALCQEVHADASKHSGRLTQDSNTQVTERHGSGHEGNWQDNRKKPWL